MYQIKDIFQMAKQSTNVKLKQQTIKLYIYTLTVLILTLHSHFIMI